MRISTILCLCLAADWAQSVPAQEPLPASAAPNIGLIAAMPPVATVMPYAGTKIDEENTGWMLCDGRALEIPRDAKDRLWAIYQVIGKTYGSEEREGHSYFKLPDLRGRVPVGLNNMGGKDAGTLSPNGGARGGVNANTLGAMGGEELHKLTVSEMPKHDHQVKDKGHGHDGSFVRQSSGPGGGGTLGGTFLLRSKGEVAGAPLHIEPSHADISEIKQGEDLPHNNVQPCVVLNYIIRYR